MITGKLTSEVFKDFEENGYQEGDMRLTVHLEHNDEEIK